MMNDKVALQWAQAFAARALKVQDPVDSAYKLAYSRSPDAWEKDAISTFFFKQKTVIAERLAHGEKIALPAEMPANVEPAYAAAFVDFCQMLLNSNEFVYRN